MNDAIDQEIYTDRTYGRKVWAAAKQAALQVGFDRDSEQILFARVDGIDQLHPDYVKLTFPLCLKAPCNYSPDEFIEIVYTTWSIATDYEGSLSINDLESAIVCRTEKIIADLPTLLSNQILTYGLGREYNFIEWKELGPNAEALPTGVIRVIKELIADDWKDRIQDYYSAHDLDLKSIPRSLRNVALEVISESDEGNVDVCPFCSQRNDYLADYSCEHVLAWVCDNHIEIPPSLEELDSVWREFSDAVTTQLDEDVLTSSAIKKLSQKDAAKLIDLAKNGMGCEHALYTLKSVQLGESWSTNGMLGSGNELIYIRSKLDLDKLVMKIKSLTTLITSSGRKEPAHD